MNSKTIEMDTITLTKLSKVFLEHQILWQKKFKYFTGDLRLAFKKLSEIFPEKSQNDLECILNEFRDDHLSTIIKLIVGFTEMTPDAYETQQQVPEWLWWLRKDMQEIPVCYNVWKIMEFLMKFANSMWKVMEKMYGVTDVQRGQDGLDSGPSSENSTIYTNISTEYIDYTPLKCLIKEYNITEEKLQLIWCRWREVIIAKLSAFSRGDFGLSPLRTVDWLLVDQLLLFDCQMPTLIQEDFEPIRKRLQVLFHLVTKHQLEECDLKERRARWDLVHREYNSANNVGQASCVVLQRWWYELKLSTQRVFRKLWQRLRSHYTYADTPLPEVLHCDVALRYPHVVTEELPSWAELVRSGGVIILMGMTDDTPKGKQDQPRIQPIDMNNSILPNETVSTAVSTQQSSDNEYHQQYSTEMFSNKSNNELVTINKVNIFETEDSVSNEKEHNSDQNLLDFLNKVPPSEVKTEITIESDDEVTISANTVNNNKTTNEEHDHCLETFNNIYPTLETACGEVCPNLSKNININRKSKTLNTYILSKRLIRKLNKIVHIKNPSYYSQIMRKRGKTRKSSYSDTPSSDSDRDSDSHSDESDGSNRSEGADFKYSTEQILKDCKVILTKLEDISVWREKSYTKIVDNDQLQMILLNSDVSRGLTCSTVNYDSEKRKRKFKTTTGPNKRSKVDTESDIEENKSLGDKLDVTKEERNGRVAKKIKLQDIEEIRRINKDILTAQVAPMTVNKAETEENSTKKNVDESVNNTSTDETKSVDVVPELRKTSNGDQTKEDSWRPPEKPNIGYLLCGGKTQDIIRFLSRKNEKVKRNWKAPSIKALLKLIDYFDVGYHNRRMAHCCQASRARSIVLAQRRQYVNKNPSRPTTSCRLFFAQQHDILHAKSECACCCKHVLKEARSPSEKEYLEVLTYIGGLLSDAKKECVSLSEDRTIKILRNFTKAFGKMKIIRIFDNRDSKELEGPILEPSKETINKKQSLLRPVDSTHNLKDGLNNNVQRSSDKSDITNKSFEESYKDWVTEKNKCGLLFGYKPRNKTNGNTASETQETQSNANSNSPAKTQTTERYITINGVDSPIQTTKVICKTALTETNTLGSKVIHPRDPRYTQKINETTTKPATDKRAEDILRSRRDEVMNSKTGVIHEVLDSDDELDSRNGDKSFVSKSIEVPITLEKSKAMKPVAISRSYESSQLIKKSKEKSVEPQLNAAFEEVINKSQPALNSEKTNETVVDTKKNDNSHVLILDPAFCKHFVDEFNKGVPDLMLISKSSDSLNDATNPVISCEASQASTSSQSEAINPSTSLNSIKISNVVSLKDERKFNGLSMAPPLSAAKYIVGKHMTKVNILCMDVSKPVWRVGGDYLVVTYTPHLFENKQFFTMCPGAQAELILDDRTSLLKSKSGASYSPPEQIVFEDKVLQKIVSSPPTYATILFVLPSSLQCRKLLLMTNAVLLLYGLKDGELHDLMRVRMDSPTVGSSQYGLICRKPDALAALMKELNDYKNEVIQIDSSSDSETK